MQMLLPLLTFHRVAMLTCPACMSGTPLLTRRLLVRLLTSASQHHNLSHKTSDAPTAMVQMLAVVLVEQSRRTENFVC